MATEDLRDKDISLPNLYPLLDEAQLKKTAENLELYLELVLQVYERLKADPEAYSQYAVLTSSLRNSTMSDKDLRS